MPEPNTPATGAPTISGTVQVGETLTADTSGIDDPDGLDDVAYSYQWSRSDESADADISGATDSTYTLVSADKDKTMKVRVGFTDDADNEETLTSEATATVDPAANSPAAGAPAITGTAQVGKTLTADTSGIADADGMSGATFSYQWLSSRDTEIGGATDHTYTLVAADEGKTIKVRVIFSDEADNEETLTSAATAAVAAAPNNPATGFPTISVTAQVGETLTVDTSGIEDADGLTNASFGYQWLADYAYITGATGSSYTLVDADVDKPIRVRVSFTNEEGNEVRVTSAATGPVAARPYSAAPGEPTGLRAESGRDGVVLSWQPPEKYDVTGYRVLRQRPEQGEASLRVHQENTGSTAATWTDTSVVDGVEYVYSVRAVNADGGGPRSAVTRLRYDGPAPGPPQRLLAQGVSGGIGLTWNAPGDDPVTGYRIMRRKPQECQPDFVVHVEDTGNAETAYTDTSVEDGPSYICVVKAINGNFVGPDSNMGVMRYDGAQPDGTPPAPSNLNGLSTKGGVELKWESPSDSAVTGFQVLRRQLNGCEHISRVIKEDTGNETTYFDEDAIIGVRYEYVVKAINEHGAGAPSAVINILMVKAVIFMVAATGGDPDSLAPMESIQTNLSVGHLDRDGDDSTLDYTVRGDVYRQSDKSDADFCEGAGLGTDHDLYVVDEAVESFEFTFGGQRDCAGDTYLVRITLKDHNATSIMHMEMEFTVN